MYDKDDVYVELGSSHSHVHQVRQHWSVVCTGFGFTDRCLRNRSVEVFS